MQDIDDNHPRAGNRQGTDATSLATLLPDPSAPVGVIADDGRLIGMTPPLLGSLGFDARDDLRGLAFTSLWHHAERPQVTAALRHARAGHATKLTLDLSYLQDRDARCEVTLCRLDDAAVVIAEISCPAGPTSG